MKFFIMKWKFIAKNYWWYYTQYLLHKIYLLLQKILLQFKWRRKNRHNSTSIKNIVDINKISVWNYTSWDLDVRIWNECCSFVKIWSFCCIAPECILGFFTHPTDRLIHERIEKYFAPWFKSRFVNPKKLKCNIWKNDIELIHERTVEKDNKICHGPIIIEDDVRLWTWAKIMPWVRIWQWAAIWAWAIVTKDIPPYAIAVWIPAKVKKYRFSEEKIKKLLQIDFENLSLEKLREIYPETIKEDFDIDYILGELKR